MRGLIGHQSAVAMLRRVVVADAPGHAYLIAGPPQVGKATLALRFAMALNCESADAERRPCGECWHCRRIENANHPDVRILRLGVHLAPDAARQGRSAERKIPIDDIRAMQADAALAPYRGRWKVFLILDAEDLSLPAMNGLLKLLEEPPSRVVLVLTATDVQAIVPTIVSRCQVLRLGPVRVEEIADGLRRQFKASEDDADKIARIAEGRVGRAIELIHKPDEIAARRDMLADLVRLGTAPRADRFAFAETLASSFSRRPDEVYHRLGLWRSWWRDLLFIVLGCGQLVVNQDWRDALDQAASSFTPEAVHRALRALTVAEERLRQNVNPRLALEALMVDLP